MSHIHVILCSDVVLSFVTGYVRHIDGKTEYHFRTVAWHYLKTWFLIDIVSVFPVNYIPLIVDGAENANTAGRMRNIRLMRFLKLLKLLRLVRIKRILERYEALLGVLHSTASNWLEMFKLTVAIFFVGHILSCFWFLAGGDEMDDLDACNITAEEDCVKSYGWISNQGMSLGETSNVNGEAINRFDQYLHSLYWAMTTMTTVGVSSHAVCLCSLLV